MKNKGFTIIELLIVISLVSTMSVLVFYDYGKNTKVFALERNAQKISQDLRITQQKSMAGEGSSEGLNAYGIIFDVSNNNYSVYVNNNETPYYDTGDDIIETIEMSPDVKILNIEKDGVSRSTISISFFPPDPIIYIYDDYNNAEAIITLSLVDDETKKRIVKINNSGGVEILKDE